MADITMCPGTGCPMQDKCYRANARPSMMQSWFSEMPLQPDGTCAEFIEPRNKRPAEGREPQAK